MKWFAFSCLFGILWLSVVPAQGQRKCGTMEYLSRQLRKDPSMTARMTRIERSTEMKPKGQGRQEVIRIPVVIHVMYHTSDQNISDAQVRSQIEVLNEDFRGRNQARQKTNPLFQGLVADTRLEFVLANVDPQGNPTNGITRTYTEKPTFIPFSDDMKYNISGGHDAWPSESYLNIWVCGLAMEVLGFAQFPGGNPYTDGVVISYTSFGRIGKLRAPYTLGRTATHEIGHWLNLRHIWGDTACGDDLVEDTPPAAYPHQGCVKSDSSCNSPDMVQNFMDYTDDACMTFFTHGQKHRMRSLFDPGGVRVAMINSKGYNPQPSVQCASPVHITTQQVTDSTALIGWESQSSSSQFLIRMRSDRDRKWKTRRFSGNSARIYQLWSCTTYEYQIMSVCGGDTSEYSAPVSFRTKGCNSQVPTGLVASGVTHSSAQVSWGAVPLAQGYELQYRRKGTRNVVSKKVRNTQIGIDGLLAGQTYQFRVRAIVSNQFSPYSRVSSFSTQGVNGRMARTSSTPISFSPDPAQNFLQIRVDESHSQNYDIIVQNTRGQAVLQRRQVPISANRPYRVDIRYFAEGTYMLRLLDATGKDIQHEFTVKR